MPSAGVEKLKLGVERLAKAESDPDMLGAALTSIHGALEDRFRHLLALTPAISASDHARILDVSRVQWGELIDLMRLHRNLSAEDATLIRTMNRERQDIAHGERFRGRRAAIERYASFVRGFFPEFEQQTIVVASPLLASNATPKPPRRIIPARTPAPIETPAKPAQPAAKPVASRANSQAVVKPIQTPASTSKAEPASRTPTAQKASPPRVVQRKAATPRTRPPARLNPGLILTLGLVLIVACAAIGTLIQSQTQAGSPTAPTIAPFAPPLPTMSTPQLRIVTGELNLRAEPSLTGRVLRVMPDNATLTLLEDGPQRDGHRWVRVRYEESEGWADAAFLREP